MTKKKNSPTKPTPMPTKSPANPAPNPDHAKAPVARQVKSRQEDGAARTLNFPIVGIGASAGGLAAFEAFFTNIPATHDPGMAFVLVQHLAPDHKSILAELIQRFTSMPVFEIEDGMTIHPNCVYIIPPNRDLAFLNGTLHLLPLFAPRIHRLPIDFFFRSLAQDLRERAIAIVLSGTGSDGTLGVREVKGEGGMVMAQLPESAEYDGMPQSAINTGLVDYVLPAAEMPAQLLAYATHLFNKRGKASVAEPIKAHDALQRIFILLRDQSGHDFSEYKENTIIRRVERRMAVQQIERLDEYVLYLQHNPTETHALFRDILIGVTSFFRDPEAYAALAAHVVPQLFAGRQPGEAIRVWVSACSTGEEAYSIAMLLQEQMEALKQHFRVQVFATDIDSHAIQTARFGIYPASIANTVSPERLSRFFTLQRDGKSYRVNKGIRDLLVFSEQDIIRDPPFSKVDLVSCRNLLIYMGETLQKKLIPLFHYALNPTGILFLGTSESVGEFRDLFATLDRKAKLYASKQRAVGEERQAMREFIRPLTAGKLGHADYGQPPTERKLSRQELTERLLLQRYTPASVLVNQSGEILYLHGRTGRYLEMAAGDIGVNILRMAREGLRRDLTTAFHLAVTHKEPVSRPGLRVKTNGGFSTVNLTVHPLTADSVSNNPSTPLSPSVSMPPDKRPLGDFKVGHESTTDSFHYLVILEEVSAVEEGTTDTASPLDLAEGPTANDSSTQALIAALHQELQAKEEYLQSTTEELEASGEEMQSINEELQSSNEELETSKEELQSINEELTTVNAELQNKVTDLLRANNDINNLMAGTGIGTIFIDHQMLVQRFTPAVTQVINLIPSDVGRPLGHTTTNLANYTRLEEDVKAVLNSLTPMGIAVQAKSGAWFMMDIRPYRTMENVPEGVVINFIEISKMIAAQESLRRLAVVVNDSADAITMRDLAGRILAWNPAAHRMYGWSEPEALAMNIRELIPASLRPEALIKVQQLSQAESLEPYQTQRLTKDGKILTVSIIATALHNQAGEVYAISCTERLSAMESQS
jgi:two-component system CheB/CheR fusion protein